MKRFYKVVTIGVVAEGYSILLDGKPVKTKDGSVLFSKSKEVAERLMLEWASQIDVIKVDEMPLMQIVSTRLDKIPKERQAIANVILRYLDTDLICYLTDYPKDLKKAQEHEWMPVRKWFLEKSGIVLKTTSSIEALQQDSAAHGFVAEFVTSLNDDQFTILQMVTALSGSILLAMAFVDRKLNAAQILSACSIEERYKDKLYDAEKYGQDPLLEKKFTSMLRDLEAAEFYLKNTIH